MCVLAMCFPNLLLIEPFIPGAFYRTMGILMEVWQEGVPRQRSDIGATEFCFHSLSTVRYDTLYPSTFDKRKSPSPSL